MLLYLIDYQYITKTLFLLKPKRENRTISALLEAWQTGKTYRIMQCSDIILETKQK